MNKFKCRLILAVLSCLVITLGIPCLAFADSYSLILLDFPLPEGSGTSDYTSGTGINDKGQVVGEYRDAGLYHGFIYDTGVFTTFDVPFSGVAETAPLAINNRGQIVGVYLTLFPRQRGHGFLYSEGEFTEISFPLALETVVTGINNNGDIIGIYITSDISPFQTHGFLYRAGIFTTLDAPFEGVSATRPFGINDRGQIVGQYDIGQPVERAKAFVYKDGFFETLLESYGPDRATGISAQGSIVGVDFGNPLGFVYEKGQVTDFPFVGFVTPYGINASGTISGAIIDDAGMSHGFVAYPVKGMEK
jgi:uncharacterized membrane protein